MPAENPNGPRIVYGDPRPIRHHPHVTLQSVSVNGYSTWGSRLECHGCGAVDECHAGSSVSWEDHPPRFGYAHRNCGPIFPGVGAASVEQARADDAR